MVKVILSGLLLLSWYAAGEKEKTTPDCKDDYKTVTYQRDGGLFVIENNGWKTILYPDGRKSRIVPEGDSGIVPHKSVTYPAGGRTVTTFPDGSKWINYHYGGSVSTKADGSKEIVYKDQEWIKEAKWNKSPGRFL